MRAPVLCADARAKDPCSECVGPRDPLPGTFEAWGSCGRDESRRIESFHVACACRGSMERFLGVAVQCVFVPPLPPCHHAMPCLTTPILPHQRTTSTTAPTLPHSPPLRHSPAAQDRPFKCTCKCVYFCVGCIAAPQEMAVTLIDDVNQGFMLGKIVQSFRNCECNAEVLDVKDAAGNLVFTLKSDFCQYGFPMCTL